MGNACCRHAFSVRIVFAALEAARGRHPDEAAGSHLGGAFVAEPVGGVADTGTRVAVEVTVVEERLRQDL